MRPVAGQARRERHVVPGSPSCWSRTSPSRTPPTGSRSMNRSAWRCWWSWNGRIAAIDVIRNPDKLTDVPEPG
jgi:hypothetical protein